MLNLNKVHCITPGGRTKNDSRTLWTAFFSRDTQLRLKRRKYKNRPPCLFFYMICTVFIRLSILFPLCSSKLIEKSKLQTQVTNRLPTMTKYVRSESAVVATEDRRARLVLEREIEYHETMLVALRKEYSRKYGYVFFLFFFSPITPPHFGHITFSSCLNYSPRSLSPLCLVRMEQPDREERANWPVGNTSEHLPGLTARVPC